MFPVPFANMSKIPGLLGKGSRSAPFNPLEALKTKIIDKGKALVTDAPPESPLRKRVVIPFTQGLPQKRSKAPDPVAGEFFSKVTSLIKDILVRNCDNREEDNAHEATVRASSELLFHSLKECVMVHKYRELFGTDGEKGGQHLLEISILKK